MRISIGPIVDDAPGARGGDAGERAKTSCAGGIDVDAAAAVVTGLVVVQAFSYSGDDVLGFALRVGSGDLCFSRGHAFLDFRLFCGVCGLLFDLLV